MKQFIGNDLCLGYESGGRKIIIPHERRLEHVGIFGVTGSGKSRLLEFALRSDLRNWPRTRCGFLLIDPHGDVFHGIMQWVAANKLFNLPIIPIDLSSQENVIGYNILRQRESDPTVVVDGIVRAMSYVWGQHGTDATPLFERWATNVLHRLYHEGRTLADASHLFTREGAALTDSINDPLIRRDWLEAGKNWKGFDTDSMSTLNRFRRFLLNPTLRAMFGQTTGSLDFGKALQEGQIILVSLACKGGVMSEENGNLVSTLLLADLWTAAAERGKAENQKPFYVVCDEFERFLSPSISQNLAEARGFKLGLTLAAQHPQQLLTAGENGVRLYHEVMENCRTKIIFRLSSKANLEPVAEQLCMRAIDPYRVKYQHHQIATVGHEVRYLDAYGWSSTSTVGGGSQQSRTLTRSRSATANWSHTEGTNWGHTHGATHGESSGWSDSKNWNESQGTSENETTQQSEMVGGNQTSAHHATTTDSETRGVTGKDLHQYDASGLKEYMDEEHVLQSRQVAHADSNGSSDSNGTQWQRSLAASAGTATTSQRGKGGGHTQSTQRNRATTDSDTEGGSASDTLGGSETEGESDAESRGTNSMWSCAGGQSVTSSPHLIPILQYQPAAPVFLPVNEQIAIQMSAIARLKDRTALFLTGDMGEPVLIETPTVDRPEIGLTIRSLAINYYQQESGLAVEMALAKAQLKERDARACSGPLPLPEPEHYGRKIPAQRPGPNIAHEKAVG